RLSHANRWFSRQCATGRRRALVASFGHRGAELEGSVVALGAVGALHPAADRVLPLGDREAVGGRGGGVDVLLLVVHRRRQAAVRVSAQTVEPLLEASPGRSGPGGV